MDFLATFYAAVVAVENGQVGEIEIVQQTDTDGAIVTTTIYVRREVRPVEPEGVTE